MVHPVEAESRRGVPDPDQSLGLVEGERFEEDSVHHAEDGGVAPDPHLQGEHGHRREERRPRELTNRVFELCSEPVHPFTLLP